MADRLVRETMGNVPEDVSRLTQELRTLLASKRIQVEGIFTDEDITRMMKIEDQLMAEGFVLEWSITLVYDESVDAPTGRINVRVTKSGDKEFTDFLKFTGRQRLAESPEQSE